MGDDIVTSILGKPIAYWVELQKRLEKESGPEATRLLEEIVSLRGRVNFLESRILECAASIRKG